MYWNLRQRHDDIISLFVMAVAIGPTKIRSRPAVGPLFSAAWVLLVLVQEQSGSPNDLHSYVQTVLI